MPRGQRTQVLLAGYVCLPVEPKERAGRPGRNGERGPTGATGAHGAGGSGLHIEPTSRVHGGDGEQRGFHK